MKLKLRRFFLPVALLLTLPAGAKPSKPTPKQELQAIYNKINAAARKDVDAVFDYNSDEYVTIDRKGHTHDASEGRQEFSDAMAVIDSIKAVTVIQSFTGTDTEATVTVKDHGVIRAANNLNGRAIKLTVSDVARDHWVFTADGWRRTRTRILSGKDVFSKNF